jgi:hypothetical protein
MDAAATKLDDKHFSEAYDQALAFFEGDDLDMAFDLLEDLLKLDLHEYHR